KTLSYKLGETCSALSATTSPAGKATLGSSVTVNASATCTSGVSAQYRYAYQRKGSTDWTIFEDWTGSASVAWNTARLPSDVYSLRVETRANDYPWSPQATKTYTYLLGDVCSALASLGASPASPQAVGTGVGLTASATCIFGGTPEYQFVYHTLGT